MSTEDEVEDKRDVRRRRLAQRTFLVALVLLGTALAFAEWFSSTQGSAEDFAADDRQAIAQACDAALDELRALPGLGPGSTARDAVALARAEDEVFGEMLARIRGVGVDGQPAEAFARWLDDWDTVLGRRTEYVDQLEVTGAGEWRSPLDTVLRMSEYADARDIDGCMPEHLQLDVLDRPRSYESS